MRAIFVLRVCFERDRFLLIFAYQLACVELCSLEDSMAPSKKAKTLATPAALVSHPTVLVSGFVSLSGLGCM